VRLRAVACALFYGIAPSRLYEQEPHYDCSYLAHLRLNLSYAARWITFNETAGDMKFERSPPRQMAARKARMSRAEFANRLAVEASGNHVAFYTSDARHERQRILASAHRRSGTISFFSRTGFGLSLHRHGGISLCGIPNSGGTSVLWGAANDRVKRLGKDHRAFHLGPIGIYIGSDF
jgi:hypothetical protein